MTVRVDDGPEGAVLRVRAAPGASRDRIVGCHGDALKIAVSAPPEKGRANDRLLAVLAAALGTTPRDLRVVGGATSRDKLVLISGWTADALRDRLGAMFRSDS